MNVAKYSQIVKETDFTEEGDAGHIVRVLGLAGEHGSLLSEIKKEIRDGRPKRESRSAVEEELGDIVWYVTAIANQSNLDLSRDVLQLNLEKARKIGEQEVKGQSPLNKTALKAGASLSKRIIEDGVEYPKGKPDRVKCQ